MTVIGVSTSVGVDGCLITCLSHLNPCEYKVVVLAEIDCFYGVFSHHGKLKELELRAGLPFANAITHFGLGNNSLIEVLPV